MFRWDVKFFPPKDLIIDTGKFLKTWKISGIRSISESLGILDIYYTCTCEKKGTRVGFFGAF